MSRKNRPGICLVLLILLGRHLAADSGIMYFALLKYSNPDNRLADGRCCSGDENVTCINPCDILFNVTVSGSDGPSVTTQLSIGTITVNNSNNNTDAAFHHPYNFPFTDWPACVDIRVDIYNEDRSVTTEDSNRWQLVDNMTLHVQPFETPDPSYKNATLNGMRTLIPPSKLDVIIRFERNRSNDICNGDNCSDNDTQTRPDFLHSNTSSTIPEESNDVNIPICATYSSSTFSQPSEITVSMTERAAELNTSYADKTTSDVYTPTSDTQQTTVVTTTMVNLSQESSEEPGNILTTTMTYSTNDETNWSEKSTEQTNLTTTLATIVDSSHMTGETSTSVNVPTTTRQTTAVTTTMVNLSQESSEEPGNILTTTMTYSTNDETNWSEKSTEHANPTTTLATIVESSHMTSETSTSVPVLTTTQWTRETTRTKLTLITALTTRVATTTSPSTLRSPTTIPITTTFSTTVSPFTTGVTSNTSDSFMPTTTMISHDLMQYWEIILGCVLGVLILIAIVGFLVYLKRQRAMLKRQVIYTVTPRLASVVEENGTAGKSDIPVETTEY